MKIGFDAKRLFFNRTGLGNYSRTLVQDLATLYPQPEYHLYTPGEGHIPAAAGFINNQAFKLHRPGGTSIPALWRSYAIIRDLQRDNIDLYHGLSNELPLHMDRSGIKSIVTIHDLIFKVYPATYSFSERLIYDLKFRYACRHADRIIAISECTRRDIIRFYDIEPERIDVIFQACNPLYYRLRHEAENRAVAQQYQLPPAYLLYVGTIEARKNLKGIIEAYSLLKTDLRLPLVIVGKGGAYREEAIALARQKKVADNLMWLDRLQDNTHLQSVYQMASALIYPSYYEGFGLPVAEALFCRTPVITANTSSLSDAGGPGSLYIDPDSPEEIAAAIEQVLTDTTLTGQMRDTGYAYAHQHFTGTGATAKMMACYERTLQQ